MGRPQHDRKLLFHAFLAKTNFSYPTTFLLIEALKAHPFLRYLCGWLNKKDIPSSSTFSRAFNEFSKSKLAEKVHEAIVLEHVTPKIVGHISYDATAIPVSEKTNNNYTQSKIKRLHVQPLKSMDENISDLPILCNVGTKKNSQGNKNKWIGYKLHLGVIDGDIPISAILTSASLHDSQAIIPLMQMSYKRVTSFYDLMDKGYTAKSIREYSKEQGRIPLIPARKGNKTGPKFDNAQKCRYKQRSSVERVNSLLKERYRGRWIKVKSHAKVMTHLMFGILCLTVSSLMARNC